MNFPSMKLFNHKLSTAKEPVPIRIKRFRIMGDQLLYLIHGSTRRIERFGCLPEGATVLSIHECVTCPPCFDLLVEHESFEPVDPCMDPPYHLCQCSYYMHPDADAPKTQTEPQADEPTIAPAYRWDAEKDL